MTLNPPKRLTKKSTRQERKFAKDMGGSRRAYSGANRPESVFNRGTSFKGDVILKEFEVELKRTDGVSMSIKKEWLDKVSIGAIGSNRWPAIQIEFGEGECKWVMIEQSVFKKMLEKFREVETKEQDS